MTKLIERLRAHDLNLCGEWVDDTARHAWMDHADSLILESADRIEELERHAEDVGTLLRNSLRQINILEQENAELSKWRQMLGKQLQTAIADCATARREALEEAIGIAEREYKRHCTGSGFDSQPARSTAYSILQAIRSLSDSSPPLLQEQKANGGKEGE